MPSRTILLATLCLFAFITTASAQPKPPAEGEYAPKLADSVYLGRQALPKGVTLARMSNGLTVLVQENHAAPVATVRCYLHNTGSAFEGKFLGAGLSHLLEHLVSGGSTTKKKEPEVRAILDELGGQTNAYTSDEVTAFHIDAPSAKVNVAINLIAENMRYSTIPENEYLREMGVVQRELEMGEADRSRMLYNTLKQLIYTEHPARHPTIGYSNVVYQTTREQVLDFYHERYVPQNMLFVVVGDVKTDDVLKQILEDFRDFHRTTERRVELPVEPEQASPRSTRLEMEGTTTHLAVAWPTVPLQDPDLYPLDVASYILTNGDSSRLTRKLKIERPIVTSVSSASYTPGFVRGWFQVTGEFVPENQQTVSDAIFEEIERLKTEPVSEAELAKAKRQKAADHVFNQQTVENQAELLANSYLSTGDPLFDDHYVQGIQKVTPEQIVAVAKKYFVPEKQNVVLIEPLGTKPQETEVASESAAESQFVKKVLPNGLTVLLKRHAVVPMVSIQAFAKAGSVSDTDAKSGLAALACALMPRGTQLFKGDEIAAHFDSIGGSFTVDSQRNSSYLRSSVLKDDLDKSLEYAVEVLFRPTFPAEEFAKLQKLNLSRVAARKNNPQTEILDFWGAQLPKTEPFGRTVLGTVDSLKKITVEDCKQFHKAYFQPGNMVLAIVGDIDLKAVEKRVDELFGKVPAGKKLKWPTYPDREPLPEDATKHLTTQKANTAMVVLGYPIVSIYDQKTRAALEMLDSLLTGGGAAGGRLHEELRGERLVYYVFGIQMTGFAPGYFLFMAQTRPETLDEVVTRIKANLQKIADDGIPAEDFDTARKRLLAAHAMKNTTASEQAFEAALNELYGLGYDYDKKYDERINAVTVEEVVDVVKKYFAHGVLATSSPGKGEAAGE